MCTFLHTVCTAFLPFFFFFIRSFIRRSQGIQYMHDMTRRDMKGREFGSSELSKKENEEETCADSHVGFGRLRR